jgi:hypothetical protein
VVFIERKSTRDFTLEKYRELCQTLQKNGYTPLTVRDYLKGESADSRTHGGNIVILRHDVDRKIMNALRMAKLEHEMGIHSTYYFRYPYTFKPDIIREVQDLGHEIGYHYEVLSKAKGDYQKAIGLFETELEEFRKICAIDTICMHGNPLSPIDNRDLWKRYDFRDFGIDGEAYLSFQNANFQYFTDTGRSWGSNNNIRDKIDSFRSMNCMENTDELIKHIQLVRPSKIYLTAHPERWAYDMQDLIIGTASDYVMNWGKKLLWFQR